jgi:putative ABC transport system permease protein
MTPGNFFRNVLRETRGARGRLVFFTACLAVGVAGVVAVAGLSASLDRGIRGEAKQLLAADLAVSSRKPLPPQLDAMLAALPGARRADVREMVTVVAATSSDGAPGRSQLVELKAVAPGYPFYGKVALEPDRPLVELLGTDGAVVAPEMLARLGLQLGSPLKIGTKTFRITGTVATEPDRLGGAFSLGPRVFMPLSAVADTGLEGKGSRVEYKALVALAPGTTREQAKVVADGLDTALEPLGRFRVESFAEAQPSLRNGLRRAERFVGLVALLSLLIGGVGVAQTVRAWLAGRLDAIAVLKCLGMRPREVLRLYLAQAVALSALGSLIGCIAGVAVQWSVPWLLRGLLPAGVTRTIEPLALLRGFALGVGVALLFSLPPLLAALRVPPARVLRRDADPLPFGRAIQIALGALLLGGVFALAVAQSQALDLAAGFTGALVGATAALALAAWALRKLIGRLPRDWGRIWLRHGLAALTRPGAGVGAAIVALGLGVVVVLAMRLVESQLSSQLERDLPSDAPSAFLIDIQPDQWPGVQKVLQDGGATKIDAVPVVMARLTAVDGKTAEEIANEPPPGAAAKPRGPGGPGRQPQTRRERERREENGEGDGGGNRRWALTREQRLTYMQTLPADNTIVEGKLWSDPLGARKGAGADARAEVSLERDFAQDLGARVGSVLQFDIQGVPLELVVTSIRTVKWESFGINFFLVVEPGVLEQAPQQRLAAARCPRAASRRSRISSRQAFPTSPCCRRAKCWRRSAA